MNCSPFTELKDASLFKCAELETAETAIYMIAMIGCDRSNTTVHSDLTTNNIIISTSINKKIQVKEICVPKRFDSRKAKITLNNGLMHINIEADPSLVQWLYPNDI